MKNLELSDHLTYEAMRELSNQYQVDFNQLFCGYGRRPITAEPIQDGVIMITCYCAFNQHCCKKAMVEKTEWDLKECPTYMEKIFGAKK